jgi:hypothetical protein
MVGGAARWGELVGVAKISARTAAAIPTLPIAPDLSHTCGLQPQVMARPDSFLSQFSGTSTAWLKSGAYKRWEETILRRAEISAPPFSPPPGLNLLSAQHRRFFTELFRNFIYEHRKFLES